MYMYTVCCCLHLPHSSALSLELNGHGVQIPPKAAHCLDFFCISQQVLEFLTCTVHVQVTVHVYVVQSSLYLAASFPGSPSSGVHSTTSDPVERAGLKVILHSLTEQEDEPGNEASTLYLVHVYLLLAY